MYEEGLIERLSVKVRETTMAFYIETRDECKKIIEEETNMYLHMIRAAFYNSKNMFDQIGSTETLRGPVNQTFKHQVSETPQILFNLAQSLE